MFDIGKVVSDLLPAPSAYVELGNHKKVSLRDCCIIHKTGRGGPPGVENQLRISHRDGFIICLLIATVKKWVLEVSSAFRYPGTRGLLHETDSHYQADNGREVRIKDGGFFRAIITIAEPTLGFYPNTDGTSLDEAVFVPSVIIAESKRNIRFAEVYSWDGGKFAGLFHPHQSGCTSDAPLGAWDKFVRVVRETGKGVNMTDERPEATAHETVDDARPVESLTPHERDGI